MSSFSATIALSASLNRHAVLSVICGHFDISHLGYETSAYIFMTDYLGELTDACILVEKYIFVAPLC